MFIMDFQFVRCQNAKRMIRAVNQTFFLFFSFETQSLIERCLQAGATTRYSSSSTNTSTTSSSTSSRMLG